MEKLRSNHQGHQAHQETKLGIPSQFSNAPEDLVNIVPLSRNEYSLSW